MVALMTMSQTSPRMSGATAVLTGAPIGCRALSPGVTIVGTPELFETFVAFIRLILRSLAPLTRCVHHHDHDANHAPPKPAGATTTVNFCAAREQRRGSAGDAERDRS